MTSSGQPLAPRRAYWRLLMLATQELWPPSWRGELALRYLLAIGMQESGMRARTQIGGPALSYWQIEPPTVGLLTRHPRLSPILWTVAGALGLSDPYALTYCDPWAATLARALLRSDPGPLQDDEQAAWDTYLRVWRPGRPRPSAWPHAWQWARETMTGAQEGA
jgi:hypothetical protein